jgi:hypothetical protein
MEERGAAESRATSFEQNGFPGCQGTFDWLDSAKRGKFVLLS